MSLLAFIGILVAVAVIMWAVNKFGGSFMDGNILQVLNIAVLIVVVLWVVGVLFGLQLGDIQVGRITK